MGKGDKKTRRGKIIIGSYGNTRPQRTATKVNAAAAAEKATKKQAKSAKKVDAQPKAEGIETAEPKAKRVRKTAEPTAEKKTAKKESTDEAPKAKKTSKKTDEPQQDLFTEDAK